MIQNYCLLTAWIRFSLAAAVQPQAGLNLALSDTAPWLMGCICPAWNLKNRLFLVLSSVWCLLRIWPFGRSVCWCTQESCRWVGIWAKSSNTSQPCSYLREKHLLICLWWTGCHFAMAFWVALSLLSVWNFLLGPKSSCQIEALGSMFSSCWNLCASPPLFIQVVIWQLFDFSHCSLLGEMGPSVFSYEFFY